MSGIVWQGPAAVTDDRESVNLVIWIDDGTKVDGTRGNVRLTNVPMAVANGAISYMMDNQGGVVS